MNTAAQQPQKIELKNYKSPDFQVDHLNLDFDLQEDHCRVRSLMHLRKTNSTASTLNLEGEELELVHIKINGQKLTSHFEVTATELRLSNIPAEFDLEIEVKIKPQENTSLEGLYKSGGFFTTQCEAQGFRKVTYFMDRPDVMTNYTVQIEADPKKYPVLLSNGDLVRSEILASGRKRVTWNDPHKKPCYLFALVAGDLGKIEDHFVTSSGKKVKLEIYSPHGTQEKCLFAMESLKKSMKWDEERFGLEYDLSTYMIVAMDDFNAGAMENKGLNIFNSRLVLADKKTATDLNYFMIESVVGHEYFHNWTGNRVTLRDWFHLSLKEGLTVFRDQEFSMDLHSRPMVRIDTVADLRDSQFAEDAGPNAHPIRPESCYAVDNFFTSTIYEKGAEVIRMMQTMVGRPGFRKGMDLYFKRHDGQAVVIEDFAAAISEANGQQWEQFKRWYSQAGTPRVKVQENFDATKKTLTLELSQSCDPSPGQPTKENFHIPLVIGLLDSKTGKDLKIDSVDAQKNSEGQWICHLKQSKHKFVFNVEVDSKPVVSLNRGFSAPIHLSSEASDQELLLMLAHDSDPFNQWDAGQKLMVQDLSKMISVASKGQDLLPDPRLLMALGQGLANTQLDFNFRAKLVELPSISYLWQIQPTFLPEVFSRAVNTWSLAFAQTHENLLLEIYNQYHGKNDQSLHHTHMGERKLKNRVLAYLSRLPSGAPLVQKQLETAAHMTDYEAAFSMGLKIDSTRERFIQDFLSRFQDHPLTMNKWFAEIAASDHENTATRVQELWSHPLFNSKNPNRVYSLLGRWGDNLTRFHAAEGKHYAWLAEKIYELDQINPQVATRMAGAFDLCTKLEPKAKAQALQCLKSLIDKKLSKNCFEVIDRIHASLQGTPHGH